MHKIVRSSLPSRGRGLKYKVYMVLGLELVSLPSRGRGLKLFALRRPAVNPLVAPLAGAWIEITIFSV